MTCTPTNPAGLWVAAAALAILPLVSSGPVLAQQNQPDILFILNDNLGYGEIGPDGGGETRGAPTPVLDQLAREGTRLTNVNMETQRTPRRSTLLTGQSAIRSGTHAVPTAAFPRA